MELSKFFRAYIDSDSDSIIVCNTEHRILYLNPSAAKDDYSLLGKSLLNCHNSDSVAKINMVVDWFKKSPYNNRVYISHNPKTNYDNYMVALRDEDGELIGYYEKHESRNPESRPTYDID